MVTTNDNGSTHIKSKSGHTNSFPTRQSLDMKKKDKPISLAD